MPANIVQHPSAPVTFDDSFRLPMPGITGPIHVATGRQVYSEHGLCTVCHEPADLHKETTGNYTVDCDGAQLRRQFGLLRTDLSGTLHAENLFPELTAAVRAALYVDCGPQMAWAAMEIFTESELQLIARRLANTVVGTIKRIEEGGTR
jgi:hypothetical protein